MDFMIDFGQYVILVIVIVALVMFFGEVLLPIIVALAVVLAILSWIAGLLGVSIWSLILIIMFCVVIFFLINS